MIGNRNSSFFGRMGRKLFNWRLDREIFANLCPHLRNESDEGYPFTSMSEMVEETEAHAVYAQFQDLEELIDKLPAWYGKCFRYLMYRDIHQRLLMYKQIAKRSIPHEKRESHLIAEHVS